jgi:hypothetical protein
MRFSDDRDDKGRPLCQVCNRPIRPLESVPAPGGRQVHFYCFPMVRAKPTRADDSPDSIGR